MSIAREAYREGKRYCEGCNAASDTVRCKVCHKLTRGIPRNNRCLRLFRLRQSRTKN